MTVTFNFMVMTHNLKPIHMQKLELKDHSF